MINKFDNIFVSFEKFLCLEISTCHANFTVKKLEHKISVCSKSTQSHFCSYKLQTVVHNLERPFVRTDRLQD